MPAVSHNWSFIRLRDEGDEGERWRRSAMCTILEENSTPIVWLERTRPVGEERVLVGLLLMAVGWVEEEGGRVTFGFYETVEEAGSIRVLGYSVFWYMSSLLSRTYLPAPLGPNSTTLAR